MTLSTAAYVYGAVKFGFSMRSMDWMTKLIRTAIPSFTCGRTKSSHILTNGLAVAARDSVLESLKGAKYVTVHFDTSNSGDKKLLPFVVRHFDPMIGARVQFLKLSELTGETGEQVSSSIIELFQWVSDSIGSPFEAKARILCADNCNTNFDGKIPKLSGKNVYAKLVSHYNQKFLAMRCPAHYLNNAVRNAYKKLTILFNVQKIGFLVHGEFRGYTVRVALLKKHCRQNGIDYKHVLGCSLTRWLEFSPCLLRIKHLYPALRTYFNLKIFKSSEKEKTKTKNIKPVIDFFNSKYSLAWIEFSLVIAKRFHLVIQLIEGDNVSVITVVKRISRLIESLNLEHTLTLLPSSVTSLMASFTQEEKDFFTKKATTVYKEAASYLEDWTDGLFHLRIFEWTDMDDDFDEDTLEDIRSCVEYLNSEFQCPLDDSTLVDEFTVIKNRIKRCKSRWEEEQLPPMSRWVEIFRFLHSTSQPCPIFETLVCFTFSISTSNASNERVFSIIRQYWSYSKSRLSVNTLAAALYTKMDFMDSDDSPAKVFKRIQDSPSLLNALKSDNLYKSENFL